MKILFTGGGTGGHIYPLVAIAREIRRIYPKKNLELYYAGPKNDLPVALLSQEDFIVKNIISGKIRRYFSWENIIDILFKIPIGVIQSFFLLLFLRPDIVFSKGGSGSIAITYTARILRITVFLHESDVVPGLSNQTAAKWAKKVFVSFPKTEYFDAKKTTLTGNPIRKELLEGDAKKAAELFGLSLSRPVLLIMGGSQGAQALNDFVLNILNELLINYEVIHITGEKEFKGVGAEAQVIIKNDLGKFYHEASFLNEEKMKHAYKAADLIISRAGSGSIFEIAANGKPGILIPLPSAANNHQAKNAFIYSQTGAGIVLEQQNLAPNLFIDNLRFLFLNPEKLEEMRHAALAFSRPLAARAIAREILEFLMLE